MAKYFLQMTIPIESEDDNGDEVAAQAKQYLLELVDNEFLSEANLTLVREGDRSSKNLLRERVEGRFGAHLQTKKISLKELFGK